MILPLSVYNLSVKLYSQTQFKTVTDQMYLQIFMIDFGISRAQEFTICGLDSIINIFFLKIKELNLIGTHGSLIVLRSVNKFV